MIPAPSSTNEEQRKAIDRFTLTAYNNPNLMKFIEVAVDTFERKGTMRLMMDIKAGEAKGGEGSFKF